MKTHHHATEGHEHGEESVSGHSNPRAGQSNAERAAQLSNHHEEDSCAHHHEQEPEPAVLSEEQLSQQRPVSTEIPAELRERLMSALKAAPASNSTLDAIQAARGDLNFPIKWSQKGNYHSKGKIYLDRRRDESKWLSSMMHELVHLKTYLEGNAANVGTMDRETFVAEKMRDEIDAQATAYVALMQSNIEQNQSAGYNEFRALILAEHNDVFTAQNWGQIKTLALAWLEAKYRDEWRTSNSGKNYYEYWGSHWDRHNQGD